MSQSEDSSQLSQEVTLSHMSNNFSSWSSLVFPLRLWTPLPQHSEVPDNKKSSHFQGGIPPELLDLTLCKSEVGQFSKTTLSRYTCTNTVENHVKSVQLVVCQMAQDIQQGKGKCVHSMAVGYKTSVFRRCVDGSHQMVNLSKNQEVFLPNIQSVNTAPQQKQKEQKTSKNLSTQTARSNLFP